MAKSHSVQLENLDVRLSLPNLQMVLFIKLLNCSGRFFHNSEMMITAILRERVGVNTFEALVT